jgi:hypothetical protein
VNVLCNRTLQKSQRDLFSKKVVLASKENWEKLVQALKFVFGLGQMYLAGRGSKPGQSL